MKSYINEYLELPKEIHLPSDTEINEELILNLLDIHRKNIRRYKVLQEYYAGKAKILERQKDSAKSNNKIIFAYPSYIVDVLLGLFVGKPVSYTMATEDAKTMEDLQDIFDLNDEQDENTEIAKMAGIKGRAYEIVYLDEEANIRFNELDPENVIFVYDDSINPKPLFALYVRDINNLNNLNNENKDKLVTVFSKEKVAEYLVNANDNKVTLQSEDINIFNEVNIIEILNNDEGIGDFERALSAIDAMNLLNSDNANDFEEFTNAILMLWGMLGADKEDIRQMREDGIILMDPANTNKQGAEWLIKNINDTALENFKNWLDASIHKFAKVPNLSDEQFAGNVSGESMKYKLFATDQAISQKQRKFKTALVIRIKLIFKALSLKKSEDLDYKKVTITFNENRPFNELDNVNVVKTLMDITSKQFALSKLKGIDDVQEELKRQEEEKDAYAELFYKQVGEEDDVQRNTEKLSETTEREREDINK